MIRTHRIFSIILLTFIIAGCASSSSIEVASGVTISSNLSIDDIKVSNKSGETFDGTNVEAMMKAAIEEQVTQNKLRLFSEARDSHLLEIDIIQYSKGSAVKRWLLPGAGKTVLSVEATLKTPSGQIIAESQATESIGAGGLYTIGAWKKVFNKVAKSLVKDIKELVS